MTRKQTLGWATGWTLALSMCIMGSFAFSTVVSPAERPDRASIGDTVRDTALTTQSGVFTDDQANRGKNTYAAICGSCHNPSDESGDAFDQKWKDHQLADLYTYIMTQMPQNDPGSLDANTSIDVVAYILKFNQMPVGTAELAPDTLLLQHIRITRIKGPTP